MLQLEKYRTKASKHKCPACGYRGVFTRYVNESGNQITDELGRCDRESKCGYHLRPKEYFDSRGIVWSPTIMTPKPKPEPMALIEIPADYFRDSLKSVSENSFLKFLLSRYDCEDVLRVAERYSLGDFEGFTVFWRMDASGKVWTAKLIKYDPTTGKRIKDDYSLNWMHAVLKRRGVLPENSDYRRVFFGAHLVTDDSTPIAIVEAEKTAVIASLYLPEYLWLACGGKTQINAEKLAQFRRRVVLFPDGDGFAQWSKIASDARAKGANVAVSDLLENELAEAQKAGGYDLADYLLIPEIEAAPPAKTCRHCSGAVLTDDEAGLIYCLSECEPAKAERRARWASQLQSGEPSAEAMAACQYDFDERAARYEFEAGITREQSETTTSKNLRNYWLNHCRQCGSWLADSGACDVCQNRGGSTIAPL